MVGIRIMYKNSRNTITKTGIQEAMGKLKKISNSYIFSAGTKTRPICTELKNNNKNILS